MSTSEPELEGNLSDDDTEEVTDDDDLEEGMHDYDNDYDDFCDFRDTNFFSTLLDSLLEASQPGLPQAVSTSHDADHRVRSAMGFSSNSSINQNVPLSIFGDSILTYLSAPPPIQKAAPSTPYYLSFDPTTDASNSQPPLSPTLFVGNVPPGTTWKQLADFFDNQSYKVSHVDVKSNSVSVKIFVLESAHIKYCKLL
jgi:RNA recognition motif-containing protein